MDQIREYMGNGYPTKVFLEKGNDLVVLSHQVIAGGFSLDCHRSELCNIIGCYSWEACKQFMTLLHKWKIKWFNPILMVPSALNTLPTIRYLIYTEIDIWTNIRCGVSRASRVHSRSENWLIKQDVANKPACSLYLPYGQRHWNVDPSWPWEISTHMPLFLQGFG